MAQGTNEPQKEQQPENDWVLSEETLNTLVEVSRILKDELLIQLSRTISRRSDWLLGIAGATFAAIVSAGPIKPDSITWQTKELLLALLISSILGIVAKVSDNDVLDLLTLLRADAKKKRKTLEEALEKVEDTEKRRRIQNAMQASLTQQVLGIFKPALSAKEYAKLRRRMTVDETSQAPKTAKELLGRAKIVSAQFWTLFGGIFFYVLLVLVTY